MKAYPGQVNQKYFFICQITLSIVVTNYLLVEKRNMFGLHNTINKWYYLAKL